MLDGNSGYGGEDETDNDSTVFVKYNRMLHGKKTVRGQKRDTLTIKFLKKYIHYAKHRIQPDLTDEVLILHIYNFFVMIWVNYRLITLILFLHSDKWTNTNILSWTVFPVAYKIIFQTNLCIMKLSDN